MGVKKQKKLEEEWGGLPTHILITHTDTRIDTITKERYHEYLRNNIKNIYIPDPREEKANLERYKQNYQSSIKWLLEQNKNNDLLLQENINFGFLRNMLGIRVLGIISTISIFAFHIILTLTQHPPKAKGLETWGTGFVLFVYIIVWIAFVNKNTVKKSAFAYARTLLASCEK